MTETDLDRMPSLNPKVIHLWWERLESCSTTVLEWSILDPEERQRAQRFKRECDRDRYVRVRSTLRRLMASYLGIPASEVKLCYGLKGKPKLDLACHGRGIEFNVSHSHHVALWGFSRDQELGVDVEYLKPNFQAEPIAQRFFTAQEFQSFQAQDLEQQRRFFFQLWTRKEACIKARGESLFEQISRLEVPHHERYTSHWSSLDDGSIYVRDLDLHEDYTAAVATFSGENQLFCFKVDDWKG